MRVQRLLALASTAAVAMIACTSRAASVRAQGSLATPGCWRFDRPLGSSFAGNVEGADSSWRVVAFRRGGGVTFPLMPGARSREMWERKSGWRAERDSIRAFVFTGLVGWELVLRVVRGAPGTRAGIATYLSDAIVIGRAPQRVPVRAVATACPTDFDVATPVRPGWDPDRAIPYFESQVDTRAALLDDSPRPKLSAGERVNGLVRSMLAMFVVDPSGRIDSVTVQYPRLKGDRLDENDRVVLQRAVARTITLMRYRPATLKGKPVAQLLYETFSFD